MPKQLVTFGANLFGLPKKLTRQRWLPILLVPALYLTGSACQLIAQDETSSQSVLRKLDSPNWKVRYEAVHSLSTVPLDRIVPEVRQRLMTLLAAENKAKWDKLRGITPDNTYPTSGPASERWSEYYAALLGIVVGLHEEQALPLLVDSADSTMSHLNTTIAAYGAAALPFVLDRLKELSTLTVKMPGYSGPPIQSQMALADILAQMILLDQNHKLDPPLTANNYEEILQGLHPLLLSPSSYVQFYAAITLALGVDSRDANTIRKIFAQQLASPSPGERIITLQKLSEISDPAFIPLAKVKDLAENDPFFGQPLPGLNPLFRGPAVRRLAKRVLQKFPDN